MLLLSSCTSQAQVKEEILIPYDLNKPAEKYQLPLELAEISGIASNKGLILCIQDERADIFVFDPGQKMVINKYISGLKGDYEDIAVKDSIVFLIRSSGTIVKIQDYSGARIVKEYNTELAPKNDTEGLTYDQASNSLLVSCKEYPDLVDENRYKGYKTIYKFSLDANKLLKEPYITININNPECFNDTALFRKFLSFRERRPEITGYKPSGLAFHPENHDLYLISGSGRLLLVLNENGKIKSFGYLPPEHFVQPEGITFSTSGDMFISNEGKGGNGYILRFSYSR